MAIDLTGISNVNEFYSHHYLDSVLEGDLKGLFTKWKESEEKSPVQNLEGLTAKYFKAKSQTVGIKADSEIESISTQWHLEFLSALGYNASIQKKYLDSGNAIDVLLAEQKFDSEYLWAIEIPFVSEEVSIFDYALFTNKNEDDYAVATLEEVINEVFRQNEAPKWMLVLTGQKVLLLNRHKWGQGKYLLFDLDEILGRKQQETLKAAAALLSKDSLLPEEGEVLLDTLDENSHKHAFSVSEDLKYGIRKAVELLGNEYIYYRSKVAKQKVYGDPELANKLTQESLSYMYRLLFLFYAESRGEELNLVPVKSEEYRLGYSLESLRDLEQVPLITEKAREGYYLHESLKVLFKIINDGYGNERQLNYEFETNEYIDNGFDIKGLRSPLFDPKQTPLLSSIKIRNLVLQNIIQLLSLSKEGSKQRGRISYAQLGINQLGAVYEGLLSYSGFFAEERLFEVKPEGSKDFDEVYFVPESKIGDYKETEFVYEKDEVGHSIKKVHERGTFIFRLAGRDREKSASYYTPEVLTQSLVKYSLKELLKDKTADEILELKVCEPAMGSGAFLNETINQLAEAYLDLKQKELKQTIPVDEYTKEKQKVKYYIASNNIYGVDMNPVAIELAKVSLWLNVISDENETPWFSHKLANGNSLMGARLAVYDKNLNLKNLNTFNERGKEEFYHFLILNEKMIGIDNDKIIKENFPDEVKEALNWRKKISVIDINNYTNELETISDKIDKLLKSYLNKRKSLLEICKSNKNIWGNNIKREKTLSIAEKEMALQKIKAIGNEYSVLKCIFDYWSSLWIMPIDRVHLVPDQNNFLLKIDDILSYLNCPDKIREFYDMNIGFNINNKFLHWCLEFPEIFEKQGGFDLIVGNPPWIKLVWEEKGILSEKNPLLNIRKNTANEVGKLRTIILNEGNTLEEYVFEYSTITGQKSYYNGEFYKILEGVQTNLYKNFIVQSFNLTKANGVIAFIHHEGIYDDPKANALRRYLYPQLMYHFHFINELSLFADVGHAVKYGSSIFVKRSNDSDEVGFINICNVFHPVTIDQSIEGYSEGRTPSFKDEQFMWEKRGHKNRIVEVNNKTLSIINSLFEENINVNETKLINIHSVEILEVMKKMALYDRTLKQTTKAIFTTVMFDETNDQKNKNIIRKTHFPSNINELVLSGPHFHVATPLYQTPNENCKSHGDYSKLNLANLDLNYIPRSNYIISNKESLTKYGDRLTTDYYRLIFRKMLDVKGERTLIGSIIPKGPAHINGCVTVGFEDLEEMCLFSGMTSSLILDFYIRITGKSNLGKVLINLPTVSKDHALSNFIINRVLRLNCLTLNYNELWETMSGKMPVKDYIKKANGETRVLNKSINYISKEDLILTDYERRYALVQLDVLAALVLNLTLEELLIIYRIQFSVLQKYESNNYYDYNGNLVSAAVVKKYLKEEVKDIEMFEGYTLPFIQCNREEDYRREYEYFNVILKEGANHL